MQALIAILFVFLALSGCSKSDNATPESKNANSSADAESVEEAVSSHFLLNAMARYIVGDVDVQKKQKKKKKLQIGGRVYENDLVSTGFESEADLSLADGSVLKVIENTDALFAAEMDGDSKKLIIIDITKGRVHFDIQKQKNREVKFKTSTAIAAIRGTVGFVGNVKGKTVASLKEGKVEVVSNSGEVRSIADNQTILVDEQGKSKMLKLKSSGTETLSKALDSIAVSEVPVETLEKSLKTFDASYTAKLNAFEKSLQFRATSIGDSVFVPTVTLTARATPGIWVTVWGEQDSIGANGIYQRTFTWSDSAYGTKRFLASCSDGYVEMPCFMWVTEYVATPALNGEVAGDSSAETIGKDLNMSVKINGARSERIHLDPPQTELSTNLKFNLAGISQGDLNNIASISVLRNGKPFKTIGANDLTSLNYEVPVKIARNRIADFEVVATLKNGKNYRAKKTFEVYCLLTNHPGGKARNSIVPPDQEYERLKQSGELKHE